MPFLQAIFTTISTSGFELLLSNTLQHEENVKDLIPSGTIQNLSPTATQTCNNPPPPSHGSQLPLFRITCSTSHQDWRPRLYNGRAGSFPGSSQPSASGTTIQHTQHIQKQQHIMTMPKLRYWSVPINDPRPVRRTWAPRPY